MASTSTKHAEDHDHIDSDPGPMYKVEWVQKLLKQIANLLQTNDSWLGIDRSKPVRILDYACGHGTVSSALFDAFPNALFRGLDIATSQVKRYNHEAAKRLGLEDGSDAESGPSSRMFAIQGDLTQPHADLSNPGWTGFDAAIISMALHHVREPGEFLKLLRQRIRPGGVLVVIDFLQVSGSESGSQKGSSDTGTMTKLEEGMKIWPGFSLDAIHAHMSSAGCKDVEVRLYPEPIEAPSEMRGFNKMYISKGTVV